MRMTLIAMTAAIATLSAAPAQQLLAYDPFAGIITENQLWTAMLPFPGAPTNAYPAVPMPVIGPAIVPMPGDNTFDGTTGLHWLCSGAMLAAQPTPLYPPTAPPVAPFPIAPAVVAALGGFITGIAIDPAAGIMWLAGPVGMFAGVAPIPGTPVIVPPFPLAFAIPPIAGLDWDGLTGTLYAVDIGGVVHPFLPGGFPAGPPIATPFPFFGPITGIAVDKSGQLNPVAARPIYVTDGVMVIDVTLPLPAPFPPGPPMNVGIAYLPAPASNPPGPGVACACPTFAAGPVQTTRGPMVAGNAGWGIGVGGIPAGQPVLFGFDFFFDPTWPMINGVGCPLGFLLGSPTLVTLIGFADAAGNAVYPFPLPAFPGFGAIYNQNFTFCPADPAGFVVTPMQSIWLSGL